MRSGGPVAIPSGTASLFAAHNVASGFVTGKCYKRHWATEFLDLSSISLHSREVHIREIMPPAVRRSGHGWRADVTVMSTSRAHIGILDQFGRTLVR